MALFRCYSRDTISSAHRKRPVMNLHYPALSSTIQTVPDNVPILDVIARDSHNSQNPVYLILTWVAALEATGCNQKTRRGASNLQ
jgi:hypothetical protein